MSKERYTRIIDEVYDGYLKSFEKQSLVEQYSFDTDPMTKEMFIEKIKFLGEFSQKWGLKIEERKLSLDERKEFAINKHPLVSPDLMTNELLNSNNVPTKLITLTYQNEKIEVYE